MTVSLHAQQVFWDAQALADIWSKKDSTRYQEGLRILARYSGIANPTPAQMKAAFALNPVIPSLLDTIRAYYNSRTVVELASIATGRGRANDERQRAKSLMDSIQSNQSLRRDATRGLQRALADSLVADSIPPLSSDLQQLIKQRWSPGRELALVLTNLRYEFESIIADTVSNPPEARENARVLWERLSAYDISRTQLSLIDRMLTSGDNIDSSWSNLKQKISTELQKHISALTVLEAQAALLDRQSRMFAESIGVRASVSERYEDYSAGFGIVYQSAPPQDQPMTINVLGGSRESSLLDATATFIADRMKEEISIAFLEEIKGSDFVQMYFPKTWRLLRDASERDYSTLLGILSSTVRSDLQDLVYTLPEWGLKETRFSRAASFAVAATSILENVRSGRSIMHIVDQLGDTSKAHFKTLDITFASRLRALSVLVRSLADSSNRRTGWISIEKIRSLDPASDHKNMFVGLLYQRLITEKLDSLLKMSGENVYRTIRNLVFQIEYADAQYRKLHEQVFEAKPVSHEDFVELFRRTAGLLTVLQESPLTGAIVPDSAFDAVRDAQNLIADIYHAAFIEDYGALFSSMYFLIQHVYGDSFDTRGKLMRFGTFFVALANATSTEDIRKAINAATLPAGSYSLKRKSKENLSLNAYAGVIAGGEQLQVAEKPIGFNGGFSAPIGFSFTSNGSDTSSRTHTWFLSVLDLGALVNFRLDGKTDALPANVEVASFVSPGLYYFCNAKKGPTAWGIGLSYSPRLREVRESGITLMKSALRLNLVFMIDIPMFDLYTEARDESTLVGK